MPVSRLLVRAPLLLSLLFLAGPLSLCGAAASRRDPESCQLRVSTVPSEATVSLDQILMDATPATLTGLAQGTYLLIVRKQGYREVRRTVHLTPGQKLAIDIPLEPIYGLLLVHSKPEGADVQINGADRGKTPLFLSGVPLGPSRLRISHAGCLPKEMDLNISDRTPVRISVDLTSDSATLLVDTDPSGAAVTLNGVLSGTTPVTLERIPTDDNQIELRLDGYAPVAQIVALQPGQTEHLAIILKPLPATLNVVSWPAGARVYLDDQFRGETPLTLDGLAPGSRTVRVEQTGYRTETQTVALVRDQKRTEEFRLERNCGLLEFTTEPAGVTVFLDGQDLGLTTAKTGETDRISEPFRVDLLSIGTHKLQLTRKGFYEQSLTIEIARDKTVTLHPVLKKRFIPDCEVQTASGVFRGVLEEVDPLGNVRLETGPGITRTFTTNEVKARKTIRDVEGP